MRVVENVVDDINVSILAPETVSGDQPLVLWLTHLGGSAEKERPTMASYVERGHPVVSFDPPGHGRRATSSDPRAFAEEVLGSFRARMWPLLGRTTLEAMRVVTWAQQLLGEPDRPVVAGGVSMGGDVAVALAGVDERVSRVAAVGATPNWERPGMRSIADPDQLLDQGTADPSAQWFADQLDPSRHLNRYKRQIAIAFELGGTDRHIPAENALEFREALLAQDATGVDRVRITMHEGLDHFGVTTDMNALRSAADWLILRPVT